MALKTYMITSKRDSVLEKRIALGIFYRNTLEKIHFDIIVLCKTDKTIIASRHIFCQGWDETKNVPFIFEHSVSCYINIAGSSH